MLVSSAGIQTVHPIEEFSYADWQKTIAIHLDGAFLTTRACLRHMYRSGRGGSIIIYIGSLSSFYYNIRTAGPFAGVRIRF